MDEHRGIDWYLLHLLPVVGIWAFTGYLVGQHVWKDGVHGTATQGAWMAPWQAFAATGA